MAVIEGHKVKLFSMHTNDELAQVFSALVLLPPQESKFVKTLELLTLRRSHTLDPAQISQLLKSYAYMG